MEAPLLARQQGNLLSRWWTVVSGLDERHRGTAIRKREILIKVAEP